MAGVRGQGRKFDLDHALDIAMEQFWRYGYEGTSVAGLTKAIGIATPSLYAAFGDKRQLFDSVVEHYLRGPGGWMERAFAEETSATRLARRLLREAASHYADPDHPGGCLLVIAGACVADSNDAVARQLRDHRNRNMALLAERLAEGVRTGELPPHFDPEAAAEFLGVVIQGMSARARDGATVADLESAAEFAFRSLGIGTGANGA
ncbi:TetR/AcrR family transcriptional regulator [Nocardia shimofusensis]|uniref:TetR/AcrR family transcriptional regulator n=1 Tax=Nocardia shimofusensis TaxID=228596 RepID=UPI000837A6FC|nr:TetR/AcrR family transcriptional regulator [Nocardia shimofusensis]